MIFHKVSITEFLIRLESGEQICASLLNFIAKTKFQSAVFYGIGATSEVILGCYDQKLKDYNFKLFQDQLEIASLTGNITYKKEKLYLHAHIVLSNENGFNIAGHLKEAKANPTCEIYLKGFDVKISRALDKSSRLYLIE